MAEELEFTLGRHCYWLTDFYKQIQPDKPHQLCRNIFQAPAARMLPQGCSFKLVACAGQMTAGGKVKDEEKESNHGATTAVPALRDSLRRVQAHQSTQVAGAQQWRRGFGVKLAVTASSTSLLRRHDQSRAEVAKMDQPGASTTRRSRVSNSHQTLVNRYLGSFAMLLAHRARARVAGQCPCLGML